MLKVLLIFSLIFAFTLRNAFEGLQSNAFHTLKTNLIKVSKEVAVSALTSQQNNNVIVRRQINKGSEKWMLTRTNYYAVDYG